MVVASLPKAADLARAAIRSARRAALRRAANAQARKVRLRFSFPTARRANLTVTFDGGSERGPFAVRALLVQGRRAHLTRDSVDGLPDGEDPLEVVAPMNPSPAFGDNVHRVLGAIGIEALRGEPHGQVLVEIVDRRGRTLAAVRRSF